MAEYQKGDITNAKIIKLDDGYHVDNNGVIGGYWLLTPSPFNFDVNHTGIGIGDGHDAGGFAIIASAASINNDNIRLYGRFGCGVAGGYVAQLVNQLNGHLSG